MRTQDTDPWWLTEGIDIIGFEDDDEESEDEETDEEDDSDEDSEEEDDSENEDDPDEDEDEDEESEDDDTAKGKRKKDDTAGLKSALRKERLARKKAERELRKLKPPVKKKAKSKEGEKPDDEEDESKSTPNPEEAAKTARLAVKLRNNAVDTAILSFGDGFKSTKELLALIDRSEIDVDQDEDDPSEIDVDLETVEEAVKALRKSSPHLLKTTRSTTKSGSKFGGKRSKSTKQSEEALKKKYAALR